MDAQPEAPAEETPTEPAAEPGVAAEAVAFFAGLPSWLAVVAGLLGVVGSALGLWALYVGLGDFLVVLLLSFVTAYLLDPIIDRFEYTGWNRTVAILISIGLFLAFDAAVLLLIVPYVVTEIAEMSGQFDGYVQQLAGWVQQAQVWVGERTGMNIDLGLSDLIARIPEVTGSISGSALDPVKAVAGWAFGSTMQLIAVVVQWSLYPIFVFFLLRDFDDMKRYVFELLPFRVRRAVLDHYVEIDHKMAAFVRGQVLVAAVLAVLYSLGLLLFTDIDLALLIGVMAGVLFVVPYLGVVLGIGLGTLMALLKFGLSAQVLQVWAVFAVVQGLEGVILTPKIVGDSVGLHPLTVMIALLVGASLFGLLGMLLAVPVAAALAVLGTTAVAWYKATDWFQQGRSGAPTGEDLP